MISSTNLTGAEHSVFCGFMYLLLSVPFSIPVSQRLSVMILILRINYELCMKLQFMSGRTTSGVQYQDQCLIIFRQMGDISGENLTGHIDDVCGFLRSFVMLKFMAHITLSFKMLKIIIPVFSALPQYGICINGSSF